MKKPEIPGIPDIDLKVYGISLVVLTGMIVTLWISKIYNSPQRNLRIMQNNFEAERNEFLSCSELQKYLLNNIDSDLNLHPDDIAVSAYLHDAMPIPLATTPQPTVIVEILNKDLNRRVLFEEFRRVLGDDMKMLGHNLDITSSDWALIESGVPILSTNLEYKRNPGISILLWLGRSNPEAYPYSEDCNPDRLGIY